MSEKKLQKIGDCGSGRTFVLVHEHGRHLDFVRAATEVLALRVRAVHVESPRVTPENWAALSDELVQSIQEWGVRQCALIGFGAAGALVQHLSLTQPKLIRSMVLVDATFRPHPTRFQRYVDWLERMLPLGLPLRVRSKGFDSKPFVQRIRCPVLVVLSQEAGEFERVQAYELANRIPSAWVVDLLQAVDPIKEFSDCLDTFEQVPVKCPQKNQRRA